MDDKTRVFLTHIIENIESAEEFSADLEKEDIEKDKLRLYATVQAIIIIGEAAKNLPASFRKENPQVQWKDITGTRDRMIHHYFGIDTEILWNIIKVAV